MNTADKFVCGVFSFGFFCFYGFTFSVEKLFIIYINIYNKILAFSTDLW